MRLVLSFAFPVFDLSSAIGYLWLSHLSFFPASNANANKKRRKCILFGCWVLFVSFSFFSAPNRRITTETQHQNMCSVHMYEHFHPSFCVYQPVPSVSHSVSSPPPHPLLGEGVRGGECPPLPPGEMGCSGRKDAVAERGRGGGTPAGTAGVACSPSQQHVVYKGPYVKQSRAPKFCVCIPKTIKS